MRKILLVLLTLTFSLSLYSLDIYSSNELGQKLGLVSFRGQEGYFLEVSDNIQTLYYNSSEVCSITTTDDGYSKTIRKEYSSGEKEEYVYEEGLLKSFSNGVTSITYNYINSRLAFCVVNNSEIFFLRSTEDGSLIAIKRDSEIELLADDYLYQDGVFYNILSNSIVLTGNYETQEDGTFSFIEGGKTYHYSATGLLMSITSEEELIEYNYLEDKVSTVKTTASDGSYKLESYDKGSLIKIEQYSEKGDITSLEDYSTGKLIKTVYKNGRPVADIFYKEDNITVETIKYR